MDVDADVDVGMVDVDVGVIQISTSVTVQVWRPVHQLGWGPSATAQDKIGSRGPVRSAKIRRRGIFWTFWQLRAHIHMVSYVCH